MNTTQDKDPYPEALGHLQGLIAFQCQNIKHYAELIGSGLFTDQELTKKLKDVATRLEQANAKTEELTKPQTK